MFCMLCGSYSQQRLQCLHHNAHVRSEIGLILHTQGCYCCHLHHTMINVSATIKSHTPDIHSIGTWEIGIVNYWLALVMTSFSDTTLLCKYQVNLYTPKNTLHSMYLGNSLGRIVISQLGINTLLDFVFTEFWRCLETHQIQSVQSGAETPWLLELFTEMMQFVGQFLLRGMECRNATTTVNASVQRSIPWVKIWFTHVTRLCCPRGIVGSTGFRPVRSSKRTTPKL